MTALYAEPPQKPVVFEDCYFYHTVDVPGFGCTEGQWDLRQSVEAYLGEVPFRGTRVLEIGPASGYLTFEMEKRGASVVAVEVTDSHGWDFVPYPSERMAPVLGRRAMVMRKVKNSWWFLHQINASKAQIRYGDIYHLPDELGRFDVAVLAAVLLHVHSPLEVIGQCARHADTLVITDVLHENLEGRAVMELAPTNDNFAWDHWWRFSTDLIIQFVRVLGYRDVTLTTHKHLHAAIGQTTFFTIVARR
jgi:SAM-dependent methyltransferase